MPPCDSIIVNKTELKLANQELLAKALAAMGATVLSSNGAAMNIRYQNQIYQLSNGQLVGRNVPQRQVGETADAIKRAYSKQAVKTAASRLGWNVQETDETELVLTRRS
jgi:hypothetical protein